MYYGEYCDYFLLQLFSSFIFPITYCVFFNGVIRLLEEALPRHFHWLACMFHENELHLRRFLAKLDDKTVGPWSFAGPNLPLVKFKSTDFF